MASLKICNRTVQGKTDKITLNFVNLKGNSLFLKEEVSKVINLPPSDIELIYCGKKLQDSEPLEGAGLKAGATVFALKKFLAEKDDSQDMMADVDVRQLTQTVRAALVTQDYSAIVERMVNNPETLENVIAASPGLEKDPVAIAMLQDRALLAILAHPGNIRQILEKHPAFGQAAMMVAAAVCEEGSKMEAGAERLAPGAYSFEQMSDDEDMEPQNRQGTSVPRSAITPAQLAAALASAGGPSQPEASPQPQGGPPIISSDFFSQAIDQAQQRTTAPSDDQIQQLRDMGITDEALARRALQATGGDLQAALDLIFGDGHF
ncbi:unnamed protein product [Mytilus edulis]|uniref:Ubiquitin-like protein 7 n=2 Tax=Mytilus TaxID=6548 RepID=A0A8S3QEW0_MYTED|nr:unnamed protein product [Mytilus edulis]